MFKHLLALGFVGLFAAAVAKSNKQVCRRPSGQDPLVEFHAEMTSEMAAIKLPSQETPYGFIRRGADYHSLYSVN